MSAAAPVLAAGGCCRRQHIFPADRACLYNHRHHTSNRAADHKPKAHSDDAVLSYYRAQENPAVGQHMVRDLEELLDERVIVTNEQEQIVAASDPALIGQPLSQLDDEPAVIISRAVSSSYELPRAMPGAAGQTPMPDVQLRHMQDELLFFGAPGVAPALVHGPVPPLSAGARTASIAINRLIEDLQELALVEASPLRLMRQQTEIAPLVKRAVSAVQPGAGEKRPALELCLPPQLPALETDAERISQVLRNPPSRANPSSKLRVKPARLTHQIKAKKI